MQVNRPCLHIRWDMKQLKVLLLNIGSWQFAWVFMHVYHPKQGTESRRFYSKYRYKIDAANKHFYWVFSVLFCFVLFYCRSEFLHWINAVTKPWGGSKENQEIFTIRFYARNKAEGVFQLYSVSQDFESNRSKN